MKSTTAAKVEHRLQVAFYARWSPRSSPRPGSPSTRSTRHPLPRTDRRRPPRRRVTATRRELERARARDLLGVDDGLPGARRRPRGLPRLGPRPRDRRRSTARRVIDEPFEAMPFHLTYKCDGCLYNEFCMKWSAETDDLSLLPHLTEHDKGALRRDGITTTADLAALKDLRRRPGLGRRRDPGADRARPGPGEAALARRLAATWPVGPRLDELVHRARRYRQLEEGRHRGPGLHPGQGLQLAALLRRHAEPEPRPHLHRRPARLPARPDLPARRPGRRLRGRGRTPGRRRSVVRLTDGPPDTPAKEERLFVDWIGTCCGRSSSWPLPTRRGNRAPRSTSSSTTATSSGCCWRAWPATPRRSSARHPLYDFLTQIAAFDSPVATFLDQEIRDRRTTR